MPPAKAGIALSNVLLPLGPEDEVRRLRLQESILEEKAEPKPHPSFTVGLPYPGGSISINRSHYARGPLGGALTKGARTWMKGAILIVRTEGNRVGFNWEGPMVLRLSGRFKDKRSTPDWDNILKICKDVLARAGFLKSDRDIRSEQGSWDAIMGCDPTLVLEVRRK